MSTLLAEGGIVSGTGLVLAIITGVYLGFIYKKVLPHLNFRKAFHEETASTIPNSLRGIF